MSAAVFPRWRVGLVCDRRRESTNRKSTGDEHQALSALPDSLPRAVLKPRRAQPFFARHPWVFSGAVARVEGDPQPGAEVALVTEHGEFVARGLFNPHSNIQVRLYAWEARTPLDEAFWSSRLDDAIRLRRDILK